MTGSTAEVHWDAFIYKTFVETTKDIRAIVGACAVTDGQLIRELLNF
jgi:hypothetical protein